MRGFGIFVFDGGFCKNYGLYYLGYICYGWGMRRGEEVGDSCGEWDVWWEIVNVV